MAKPGSFRRLLRNLRKESERQIQIRMARKIIRASKSGTGTRFTPDEVHALWVSFIDHWGDLADEELVAATYFSKGAANGQ